MAKKSSHYCDDKATMWWVLIILVGAGWLGVNLGLIPMAVVRFWPVIAVIVGLLGLSGGLNRK